MKGGLKAVILYLIIVLCVFGSGTARAYGEELPKYPGIVKYECEIDYPPYKYLDDNLLTGFDLDFTKLIFFEDRL